MNLQKKANTIFDSIVNASATLAGAILIFSMLLITVAVIARYFLHSPIAWSIEISTYTLLWITFLGTAWVLRRERHVRMDMVIERLKPRHQAMLNTVTSIIIAFVCLIVTWYSLQKIISLFKMSYYTPTVLEVPLGILLVIIPIGSTMLFIQFIKRARGYRRLWKTSEDK